MINVFKAGGPWKTEAGLEYTAKSVERNEVPALSKDGWVLSIEELEKESVKEFGVDGGVRERELRDEIKALGGRSPKGATVEQLEEKLAGMKEGQQDEE